MNYKNNKKNMNWNQKINSKKIKNNKKFFKINIKML